MRGALSALCIAAASAGSALPPGARDSPQIFVHQTAWAAGGGPPGGGWGGAPNNNCADKDPNCAPQQQQHLRAPQDPRGASWPQALPHRALLTGDSDSMGGGPFIASRQSALPSFLPHLPCSDYNYECTCDDGSTCGCDYNCNMQQQCTIILYSGNLVQFSHHLQKYRWESLSART